MTNNSITVKPFNFHGFKARSFGLKGLLFHLNNVRYLPALSLKTASIIVDCVRRLQAYYKRAVQVGTRKYFNKIFG
jgi:hypothetical protein